MYNTINGLVHIEDAYDLDTISKLTDDLSMGIITKLYIQSGVHMDKIIKVLGGLRNLCALSLLNIDNPKINDWIDNVFDYIKSSIGFQLKKLRINLNRSSPDKLFQMLKSSQITKLVISGDILPTDIYQWSQYFKDNEFLEELDFTYLHGLTSEFITSLSTIKNLRILLFSRHIICENCLFAFVNCLQMLNLQKFAIDYSMSSTCIPNNNYVFGIIAALKNNYTISNIKLKGIFVHKCDLPEVFVNYIKCATNLKCLDLSSNVFNEGDVDIFKCLSTNNSISKLVMRFCHIKTPMFNSIHDMLTTNCTLRVLDLSYNKGYDDGAIMVAQALYTNTTLDTLRIGDNNLTELGVSSFIDVLKVNNTLTSLEIYGTNNYLGGKNMVEYMKENTTLRTLYIDYSKNISQMIVANSTLTNLMIDSNFFDSILYVDVAHSLESNYTILSFTASSELNIDNKTNALINSFIDRNNTIDQNNRFIKTKAIFSE